MKEKTNILFLEYEYLELCYSLIEASCEWGNKNQWKNSQFEELSFRISQKTGTSISKETLKRVFGKVTTSQKYEPQQATKDALAQFLNYRNWNDFKSQQKDILDQPQITPRFDKNKEKRKKLQNRSKKIILVNLFIVILIILVSIKIKPLITPTLVNINGKYLEGKAFHTAVFEYKINDNQEYILDFGDNQKKILQPKDSIISHYYQLPEFYNVTLKSGTKTFYDTSVYIKSLNWESYANILNNQPRYYPIKTITKFDTLLTSSTKEVFNAGIDTNEIYWVHYCNMQNLNVDGDNMIFEAQLKNEPTITQIRCNHLKVDIIGSEGRFSLYFVKPGCEKWVNLIFSEIVLNGESNDHHNFGENFSDWRDIKLEVINKDALVYIDNNLIYSIKYTKPIGNIQGIHYAFTGEGEARNTTLTKLKSIGLD